VNPRDARADARSQSEMVPGARPETEVPAAHGAPEWRHLSFRTSGLTIELEITGTGDDRRLAGQLIPRQPAGVDIKHHGGVITVEADALGRFSAEAVPLGQISLRCRLGLDQSPVITGWIII
jgi:hypothetical protein